MALTRVSRHIIDEPFNPTTVSATDVTATNINASGIGTVGTLRVTGDLTVEGTTTTLDSILTEVDRLEVSANSTVAAGIITQTGSGDIFNLYDASTNVLSVKDGGKVGIKETTPDWALHITEGSENARIKIERTNVNGVAGVIFKNTSREHHIQTNGNDFVLYDSTDYTTRIQISSVGYVGINTTSPSNRLHVKETNSNTIVGQLESSGAYSYLSIEDSSTTTGNVRVGAHGNDLVMNAGGLERLRITSAGLVRVPDNGKFVAGAGDDLQIYHNGSHSYISESSGTGDLRLVSSRTLIRDENDANHCIIANSGGSVDLYHNGNAKLATTSSGISVTGNLDVSNHINLLGDLDMGDSDFIRLGANDDLLIYHDGNNSAINDVGTGNLYIQGSDSIYFRDYDTSENHVVMNKNGSVDLYHNGTKKFETTSTGASVTGNLNLGDDNSLYFGAGNDLQIYHDSSSSSNFISASPNFKLLTDTFRLNNAANNNNIIVADSGDGVDLYFNNSKKFETTSTGAKVTGALEVTQEYPSIRPTLDLNFAATKTLDRRITFTRDSVGTYTDELGIVRTAPNNVPRFDHDPVTGESLGLLIEESRTNYFHYSESTSWENYNGGQTSLENSTLGILSPTGSTPLVIRPTNTSLTSLLSDRYGAYPSSGGTMIFSVFVKTPPGSQYEEVQLQASAVTTGNFTASLIFNISTLTTRGATGTAANAGIFDYGNGWYRICMSFTCPASTSGPIQRVSIVDDAVAQGTTQSDGLLIFGYQLELGSFPTSYIPTSGSTVTRAVDTAKITGTNFTDFYNQTEGTFFVEADTINPTYNTGITGFDGSNNNYTIVGTGDSPNRFQLRFDDQEPFQVLGFGPNSTSAITTGVSLTPTLRAKIAGAVKQNDVRGAAQGEIILTDTSFDMISPTSLFIGSLNGSSEILPGHIRKVSYYNKALPNAQLQGLTQQ